ncbi:MAG TPA: ATP-binding protein [Gaiellaceae bacterium]|nr:ATP-binding protein [Gaiellaceae bacterium]
MSVVEVLGWLALLAYAALAVVALREWRRQRMPAAAWAALAFGALAAALLATRLLPEDPGVLLDRVVGRTVIAVVVLFPYLLYRFSASFRPPSRGLERWLSGVTVLIVAWTYLTPPFPEPGEPRTTWQFAYLAAFLLHWAALSVVVAVRLWRAGRGQPSVARRRMRMLAVAAALLTVGIFVSAAAGGDRESAARGVARAIGLVGAGAFFLALAPPWLVRVAWRRPEQEALREAVGELMLATSEEDVAARVLEPMADLVGAHAVALFSADGRLVGTHGLEENERERLAGDPPAVVGDAAHILFEGGSLLVWAGPYAPFFGSEELALLRTLGDLTGLALDRSRLFDQEREARAALERTDAVKSNFVALAAHELRTPVAAIHGIAETLHARGSQLAEEQRAELRRVLLGQSTRLRLLVEQLLDLSRLEADAVKIDPRPLPVRERVEEVVGAVAAMGAGLIEVDVEPDLEAPLDAAAFDRIVTNLVVNATRYGAPPIRVSAELRDRHFRLTVEDRGPGVPPDLVPDLFERFTRGSGARAGGIGTGLGLAIARSYAQAHAGDLLYEPAEPHGARFQLVVPVEPDEAEAHVLRRERLAR